MISPFLAGMKKTFAMPTNDCEPVTCQHELGQKPVCGRFLLISVQLALARQGAKERGESDDGGRRSDDSYSPRRHRRFTSPPISVGPGLRTDV